MNKKTDFINILKDLKQIHFDGSLHYSIWKELLIDFSENPNLYFEVEIFLGTTLNAHFEASISRLFRLLDSHQDSINVIYLFNIIESNLSIFKYIDKDKLKIELSNDRALLDSRLETIKVLKILRDKYYVHLDKKYKASYDELFAENQITPNEIDELFKQMEEILTKYENYFYNFPEDLSGYYGQDDVKTVMQILKDFFKSKMNNKH